MYKQNYSDVFMINTFIMNITLLEIFFSMGSKDKTLLHEVLIYISA